LEAGPVFRKLLIANRGEIAVRIIRAASDLGIATVALYSTDDARALHVLRADEAVALAGAGTRAYLDVDSIVRLAVASHCDAVHPGYGFLSESALFARRCLEAGITFVGPPPEVLDLLGDKLRSRSLARECGVPLAAGGMDVTTVGGARRLLESLPSGSAIIIKPVFGGGGRGIRVVEQGSEVDDAFARCASEARAAFGDGALYAEQCVRRARHIEVQVAGDRTGCITHFWDRDCTIQRRHQKLIEVAPPNSLATTLRDQIIEAAVQMATHAAYESLGTFEFLVDADSVADDDGTFLFLEANPRLQVEHTVTEEVTGVDLVQTQLRLSAGATLADLGLSAGSIPPPRGFAIELRVNLETMDSSGELTSAGGTLDVFEPPSGPGVRVDAFGYAGYRTSTAFDSLLAKVVVHSTSPDYASVLRSARRALAEFRIEGVSTNLSFLGAVLDDDSVIADDVDTRFVEHNLGSLVARAAAQRRVALFSSREPGEAASDRPVLLTAGPPGTQSIETLMSGAVISVKVTEGDVLVPGSIVAVIEAMKMEHEIIARTGGIVRSVAVGVGQIVEANDPLVYIDPREDVGTADNDDAAEIDLDEIRDDLAAMRTRKLLITDEGRPSAVARRHSVGHRTARENIADLVDPGTFVEYGGLALAAQRGRLTYDELLAKSPGDGLVAGLASINGDVFDDEQSRAMVMSYDWTVLAGTQGSAGHKKADRMLQVADRFKLPLVLFAEGGGGRPGDTEMGPTGLDVMTFWYFARLSGQSPVVGVTSRFCFAGNAALLGCCDVIIATEDSNIGMAGPTMIEGAGLGLVAPTEIGPSSVQSVNGVIDVLVNDDAEAVAVAKKYLSYFQGPVPHWEAPDQRLLRHAIPEKRVRAYDIRRVIDLLADTDSVLELRRGFGEGVVTALIRLEGRPMGLIANNPQHLSGAVDADGADKSARFMQLCDAFDLPILSLCDTPGVMVGPDAEAQAQVRHVCRLFVTAANLKVPMFSIVLRKGYGLGAQASTGGSFRASVFLVSWPTGEFGGMGLEGHVRLAFRRELEEAQDPASREVLYQQLVKEMYEKGTGISLAEYLEIDDVIDPADSRSWVIRGLRSLPPRPIAEGKRRPNIDTW
jgi:acetyl/propionyl-CoA carboxylase alpha subunit